MDLTFLSTLIVGMLAADAIKAALKVMIRRYPHEKRVH